jgi:hypothetical protein
MLLADENADPTGEIYPAQPLDTGDLREGLRTCPRYTTAPQSGNAYPRWCLQEILPMPPKPFPAGADCYLCQLVIPFGEVESRQRRCPSIASTAAGSQRQLWDERIVRWARLDDARLGGTRGHLRAYGRPRRFAERVAAQLLEPLGRGGPRHRRARSG